MRNNLIVLIILLMLTLFAAIVSFSAYVPIFFGLKMILVAFYFMEMRHAHLFWKLLLVLFVVFLFSLEHIL